MNETQETLISLTGTNDERDNYNQYYFEPSLNLWGERLTIYINYILQRKIREKKISFSGQFKVSDFLNDCDLNKGSHQLFNNFLKNEAANINLNFEKKIDETTIIAKIPIFEKISKSEAKRGVVKFRVTSKYYDLVISKTILRYIVVTENEFKNYRRALSFKLSRWFKTRVSSGVENFRLNITLNEIKRLLYGQDKINWKYNSSTDKSSSSKIVSSFINNIVKPSIKEVDKYSALKIKGPVRQIESEDDLYDKTLTFIVSNQTNKLPKDVLSLVGATTNNLQQYLKQIDCKNGIEEGELKISNNNNTIEDILKENSNKNEVYQVMDIESGKEKSKELLNTQQQNKTKSSLESEELMDEIPEF